MSDPAPTAATGDARPSLLIVSYSPIADDPRVARQVRLFSERYAVTTCGYGPAPEGVVDHVRIPEEVVWWHKNRRLLAEHRYASAYLTSPVYVYLRGRLAAGAFDVVLANDADTVPLALLLRPRGGVHADLHEYATRQHESNWRWRIFVAPYYRWIVREFLPRCASVTTVGDGLALEYEREFGVPVSVVTNAPPYQRREPGSVDGPLRLVHSGYANPVRGLAETIRGVELADADVTLDLYLRDEGSGHLDELLELVTDSRRVRLHDPVPYGGLHDVLSRHDLGVFVVPPVTFNLEWTLPNKFFDFVQARLGIVVGPSPEMASLVHRHGLGVVTADFTAESLAATLEALTPEQVAGFKAASHAAAQELSAEAQLPVWERAVDAVATRPR